MMQLSGHQISEMHIEKFSMRQSFGALSGGERGKEERGIMGGLYTPTHNQQKLSSCVIK
jgi:hypothetical protein